MTATATELTHKHCQPCEGGIPALSPDEVFDYLKSLPDWKLTADGKRIRRDWRVKDFLTGLDFLNRVQRRRAVVFLLSDFRDSGYERALRYTGRRHDLIALCLRDALLYRAEHAAGRVRVLDGTHPRVEHRVDVALELRARVASDDHDHLGDAAIEKRIDRVIEKRLAVDRREQLLSAESLRRSRGGHDSDDAHARPGEANAARAR